MRARTGTAEPHAVRASPLTSSGTRFIFLLLRRALTGGAGARSASVLALELPPPPRRPCTPLARDRRPARGLVRPAGPGAIGCLLTAHRGKMLDGERSGWIVAASKTESEVASSYPPSLTRRSAVTRLQTDVCDVRVQMAGRVCVLEVLKVRGNSYWSGRGQILHLHLSVFLPSKPFTGIFKEANLPSLFGKKNQSSLLDFVHLYTRQAPTQAF